MARYNDLETTPAGTIDAPGPLAIDLTAGQAMIARRRRSDAEGAAIDDGAAVQARLPAARDAYLANSRAAFISASTPSRGTAAIVYA
jgi:hypothetical protein